MILLKHEEAKFTLQCIARLNVGSVCVCASTVHLKINEIALTKHKKCFSRIRERLTRKVHDLVRDELQLGLDRIYVDRDAFVACRSLLFHKNIRLLAGSSVIALCFLVYKSSTS